MPTNEQNQNKPSDTKEQQKGSEGGKKPSHEEVVDLERKAAEGKILNVETGRGRGRGGGGGGGGGNRGGGNFGNPQQHADAGSQSHKNTNPKE